MSIGKKLFWALLLAASWHTFGSVLYGIFVENILPTKLRAVAAVVAIINTIIFILECRKYRKITKIFFTIGNNSSRRIEKNGRHYSLILTDIFLDYTSDGKNKLIIIEGLFENTDAELTTVSGDNFLVYDQSGNQLSMYSRNEAYNQPIRVSAGRKGTFQHAYLFNNEIKYSKTNREPSQVNNEFNGIDIEYYPDTTWKYPAAIWKVTIEAIYKSVGNGRTVQVPDIDI